MPLLARLVDRTRAARAAVDTRGYAGPDGLGYTDLTAHPGTKVVIPLGTTIARIRLTRPLLAADKPPCALTDWRHGVLEDNLEVMIPQVRQRHAANDKLQTATNLWRAGTCTFVARHRAHCQSAIARTPWLLLLPRDVLHAASGALHGVIGPSLQLVSCFEHCLFPSLCSCLYLYLCHCFPCGHRDDLWCWPTHTGDKSTIPRHPCFGR